MMSDSDAEVLAALTALGYSVIEAQTAIQSIPKDAPGRCGRTPAHRTWDISQVNNQEN